MTLLRLFDVPEVLEVQEVPSDDVRIVPDLPTITKVLFAFWTLQRLFDVPDVLSVQVVPSDEVKIVPESPEITKVLFA